MPPRARLEKKKKKRNAVEVTLDHGNGSCVMRFRLPGSCFCLNIGAYTEYYLSVTTPSQATPSQAASSQATSSQARDVLAGATTSPPFVSRFGLFLRACYGRSWPYVR